MEAKIRIVEVSPKLKCFKNNPKDIISISFISDNYSVKIEDLEKAISSNDKIIVNLKESKNKNNKYQPIKYSLIRNNNNIIANGEFIPSEGIKWYKLNEIKNNISKESLITSSTSNGNIKNGNNKNNLPTNRRAHNLSDSHNSYQIEQINNFNSKNNFNKLNNNPSLPIKIKLSINLSNKKNSTKKIINANNNNHYNSIINNNYTKEPSENSLKYDELILEKDIFNEEEFTITESDITRKIPNKKNSTTSKKFNNQKKFSSGFQSKRLSKNKINFNENKHVIPPILSGAEENIDMNNAKTIVTTLNNNSKAFSPNRKNNNVSCKKFLNQDIRMKTSMGFNKRRILNENKNINENKLISKKSINDGSEIHRKINSCENIEDEILDQNFKNYLKNDEILKANLSRNNSFNSLTNNNAFKTNTNQLNTFSTNNNEFIPESNRSKINNNINVLNKKQNSKNITQDLNTNSLYNDLLSLKISSDIDFHISESISKNIITNSDKDNDNDSIANIHSSISNNINNIDNFERLKSDFLLLYSNESLSKISNDVLLLEIQLMIEKILELQNKHQKEYIEICNSINNNKKIYTNYQNKYILLIKQVNKINAKKLFNDIKDKKKEIYSENINNFINKRKKILDSGEFIIWKKMMEKSNKSQIMNNNKNKMINIFLNICSKNENNLSKLSLKFYNEVKNNQIKKNITNNNANAGKKKNKLNYNINFSEQKLAKIKMRIKDNETEANIPFTRTNHNMENNMKLNLNKAKLKNSKKKFGKINLNKNNINFGTMINENGSHNNYNVKKMKNYKNKSSSIGDKIHKKKGVNVNKSQ